MGNSDLLVDPVPMLGLQKVFQVWRRKNVEGKRTRTSWWAKESAFSYLRACTRSSGKVPHALWADRQFMQTTLFPWAQNPQCLQKGLLCPWILLQLSHSKSCFLGKQDDPLGKSSTVRIELLDSTRATRTHEDQWTWGDLCVEAR